MSSKEGAHRDDQSLSGHQVARTEEQCASTQDRWLVPGSATRKGRMVPQLLTPRDALPLQRTIGNRAVGQLLARTSEHQPIQKKESIIGLPDQDRVKPAMQIKDKAHIDDDAGLGKEMDVLGTKAVQLSKNQLSENPKNTFQSSEKHTLQRKIGYELEFAEIQAKPKDEKTKLKKGTKISEDKEGYYFTLDELPSGGFDVEVIIPELDEENNENKDRMIKALTNAEEVIGSVYDKLENIKPWIKEGRGGEKFEWSPDLNFYALGRPPTGKLQATVGLNLPGLAILRKSSPEDIIKALKIPAHGTNEGNRQEAERASSARGAIDAAVGVDRTIYASISKNMQAFLSSTRFVSSAYEQDFLQLVAVSTMLIEMPVNMRMSAFLYPKSTAGKLLHRTDFASIFKKLPDPLREHLKNYAATWSLYLLDSIDEVLQQKRENPPTIHNQDMSQEEQQMYNRHSDRRIISHNTQALANNWDNDAHPTHPEYGNELTLQQWYEDIVRQEVDRMTKSTYPGTKEQRNWIESYGGYGAKYDTTEKNVEEQRPIFEFRALPAASDVIGQATAIWDLVKYVNNRK